MLDLDELVEHWTLLDDERDLIAGKRGPTRLGFAVLLKFFTQLGRFPRGRSELPDEAVEYVARQVGVEPGDMGFYEWTGRTIKYHRAQIREHLGFRECSVADADKLAEWLAGNVCETERRSELVRGELLARCRIERIEPPAAGRIDRIVRSALHQAEQALTARIAGRLPADIAGRLRALVAVDVPDDDTGEDSVLALIKSVPGNVSLDSMLTEIRKLRAVRAVDLPDGLFADVAPRMVAAWRTRAAVESPSHLRDHPDPLLLALLAAMVEGAMRHGTAMEVEGNYVDSHGQSEIGFGITRLLGFDLLPRIKRINKVRLYRPAAGEPDTYPRLAPVLTRPIRWDLVAEQYDQMIKYATAIRTGTASVEAILRRFTRTNAIHPTYQAMIEVGRAQRTLFVARYLRDRDLQREINEGLNVVESWNRANSVIFFGKGGDIATNRRDEQELSVLCLRVLQAALVYVNTLMVQDVLADDDWAEQLTDADRRGLTPLFWTYVAPYGEVKLDMTSRLTLGVSTAAPLV
nr:Tn3 family transposase [Protofrankia symbiont of Coriaria ruscifolia]